MRFPVYINYTECVMSNTRTGYHSPLPFLPFVLDDGEEGFGQQTDQRNPEESIPAVPFEIYHPPDGNDIVDRKHYTSYDGECQFGPGARSEVIFTMFLPHIFGQKIALLTKKKASQIHACTSVHCLEFLRFYPVIVSPLNLTFLAFP